ncbi:MAG: hypothetical protein ACR2KQ_06365 [Actinomycetota bacterium]
MSVVMPFHRKTRFALGAAAVLGSLCVVILALQKTGTLSVSTLGGNDRGPVEVVDQAAEQAPWRVRVFPAGTGGRAAPAQTKAVSKQRDAVEETVTSVYDALLLQPAAIETMGGKELGPGVGAALERSKLSPSAEISDLQTTRRHARIGIQADGGRHAAARLKITAKAQVDGDPIRFRQEITMWLERTGKRWKVVAFEGSQRQLR